MSKKHHDIDKHTFKRIQAYLDGKLSPREAHLLEKEALNDPFLADALEGYESKKTETTNIEKDLKEISDYVKYRIDQETQSGGSNWRMIGIAASFAMLLTASLWIWNVLQTQSTNQLSQSEEVLEEEQDDVYPEELASAKEDLSNLNAEDDAINEMPIQIAEKETPSPKQSPKSLASKQSAQQEEPVAIADNIAAESYADQETKDSVNELENLIQQLLQQEKTFWLNQKNNQLALNEVRSAPTQSRSLMAEEIPASKKRKSEKSIDDIVAAPSASSDMAGSMKAIKAQKELAPDSVLAIIESLESGLIEVNLSNQTFHNAALLEFVRLVRLDSMSRSKEQLEYLMRSGKLDKDLGAKIQNAMP